LLTPREPAIRADPEFLDLAALALRYSLNTHGRDYFRSTAIECAYGNRRCPETPNEVAPSDLIVGMSLRQNRDEKVLFASVCRCLAHRRHGGSRGGNVVSRVISRTNLRGGFICFAGNIRPDRVVEGS